VILIRQATKADLKKEIVVLKSQLSEARSIRGRKELITKFSGSIASFQFAIAAMQELDKEFSMNSSEHIAVLQAFVDEAIKLTKNKEVIPLAPIQA